jgi:hypothetical protein
MVLRLLTAWIAAVYQVQIRDLDAEPTHPMNDDVWLVGVLDVPRGEREVTPQLLGNRIAFDDIAAGGPVETPLTWRYSNPHCRRSPALREPVNSSMSRRASAPLPACAATAAA